MSAVTILQAMPRAFRPTSAWWRPGGQLATLSSWRLALLWAMLLTLLFLRPAAAESDTIVRPPADEQAVHEVARNGTAEQMRALLQADPTQRDRRTAYGSTPLHLAAMNADAGPLTVLLAAGAPVHARDREGATPLHMAAYASRTANAQLLLDAGADPRLKSTIGRDVLSMARKVQANELAGVVSLWLLKNCQPGAPC